MLVERINNTDSNPPIPCEACYGYVLDATLSYSISDYGPVKGQMELWEKQNVSR
jgi:hypothetical protein